MIILFMKVCRKASAKNLRTVLKNKKKKGARTCIQHPERIQLL